MVRRLGGLDFLYIYLDTSGILLERFSQLSHLSFSI